MTASNRFDEALAEIERGEAWRFREPGAPNPLVIECVGWESGHTRLGDADFLIGVDREGKKWSVLVGGVVMRKRLIDGIVETYDHTTGKFEVVRTEGRVVPGEIVGLKYLGDRDGAQYAYPNFTITRRPPEPANAEGGEHDDIPF